MGASGCDPRPMRGRASGGETCHAMCASCTYISSTEPKSKTSRHCLALRPPHRAPTICNNRASVLAPLPPRALVPPQKLPPMCAPWTYPSSVGQKGRPVLHAEDAYCFPSSLTVRLASHQPVPRSFVCTHTAPAAMTAFNRQGTSSCSS